MLLLMLGYGQAAPPIVGVRAYGHTTFRAVTGGATAVTTVTHGSVAIAARTNARTTEE